MSKRKDTDWETELASDEVGDRKEKGKTMQVVLRRGLQRLANEAGITKSKCQIMTPSPKLVQCVYTSVFDDGTEWDGAADCGPANCTEPFVNFPTAVAESRAEARSLRKALGIRMLSAEEVGFAETSLDASPDKPVESSVVAAIERLCEERGVEKVDIINKVVKDKSRANSIFELKQFTTAEGSSAMSYLNALPVKKKTKRSARKEELLAAKGADK
jgi:hypothetical protein